MDENKLAMRYPYNGTFELTGRCNLNCNMCYVHVDEKRMCEKGQRELTCQEWMRITDEVFDAGTFQLLVTGGEPMMRPDFSELYTYIAQKGFYLTLYTNGTMLTDEKFEVLRKYPPHLLGITIYGVSPETYEKVCGHKEAYARVMKALPRLMTLPCKIELRATITKDNLHEAKKIEAFIKSFGNRVTFNINHTIFNSGRGSIACPSEHRLSPRENIEYYIRRYVDMVDDAIANPEKMNVIRNDMEQQQKNPSEAREEEPKGPMGCMAGWQDFAIGWNGRLMACQLMEAYSVDCINKSFQQAWEDLKNIIPDLVVPEACKVCKYAHFCGVCPASRYCETGSISGIPTYFCQTARESYNILS